MDRREVSSISARSFPGNGRSPNSLIPLLSHTRYPCHPASRRRKARYPRNHGKSPPPNGRASTPCRRFPQSSSLARVSQCATKPEAFHSSDEKSKSPLCKAGLRPLVHTGFASTTGPRTSVARSVAGRASPGSSRANHPCSGRSPQSSPKSARSGRPEKSISARRVCQHDPPLRIYRRIPCTAQWRHTFLPHA